MNENLHMRADIKPSLLNRLRRIEGQVRGVVRMVEDDRYCIDVLTQLQAVRAALSRVETEMLKDHLGHCIEGAIVSGDADEQRRKAGELIELLERAAR
jgi:DNA-binding FrmR family transcriptional regulator